MLNILKDARYIGVKPSVTPPPPGREQHLYLTLKAKFAELHLNKKKLHK